MMYNKIKHYDKLYTNQPITERESLMTNDIYTYIETNFNIKVTDYQFKRDYIKEPLKLIQNPINFGKKYELIIKDDLEYLYKILNISIYNCSNLLNISSSALKQQLKHYNIKKIGAKTNTIHGLNINQIGSKRIIEKPNYNDVYELYINQNLSIEDMSRHYGIGISFMTKIIKEYNIEKSAVLQYERRKQKMFESCGVENVFQLDVVKEKIKEKSDKLVSKRRRTMKLNGTSGKSKEEDKLYDSLIQKYPNVKRHYVCDLYPFPCDFYIPEIDTYIEYNGFWMHGDERYIGTDEQIEKVKLWESKNAIQYKRAIETWTKRDVLKRTIANNNNLNYLEFFNMDEFNKWFEEIKNPLN